MCRIDRDEPCMQPKGARLFGYFGRSGECPSAPHRGPQGPNEDLSQCPECAMPSWSLRPAGEEFGGHLPDCSLPQRHESYCVGGGVGHPDPLVRRG